jgi:hypothetical protein
MSNVIPLDQRDKEEQRRKDEMLEILGYMKKQVETGAIREFISCSLDEDGLAQIHVSTLDVPGAVGLFEIGKHILINQDAQY